MKLSHRLLTGATGFLFTTAGHAADLSTKPAVPIEFVRVCNVYGAGFFYIPGTDTCIRLSGRARYEAGVVGSHFTRNSDLANYRGQLRINIDARTETEYGTLRAFTRLEVASRTGNYVASGSQLRIGNAFNATGQDQSGRVQQYVNTDKAFIQLAGLTAGRASSFYDFYAHDFEIMGSSHGSDVQSTNLLAYTTKVTPGLTATLSLEDPSFRTQPIFSPLFTAGVANSALAPVVNGLSPLGVPTSGVYYDVTQRNRTPDFVGVLRLDQAWGSAQLSGAVHETGVGGVFGNPFGFNGGVPSTSSVRRPTTTYGFAVQGGLKVNLPMIAAGDAFYLQAAYGEGALQYTGAQIYTASYLQSSTAVQNSPFVQYLNDAVVNPLTGKLDLSNSFSVVGSLLHYWSPQWRSALFASYSEINFGRNVRQAVSLANPPGAVSVLPSFLANPAGYALSPVLRDTNQIIAGVSLIYSPVKNLDIGAEGNYIRTGLKSGRTPDITKPALAGGVPVYTVAQQETYQVRFRVQRDF